MLLALLLLMAGVTGAWGQTDFSGVYYIGSTGYVEANTTSNYYLCPTEGWNYYTSTSPYYTDTENGQPFMTTYQCRNGVYEANKAVWIVEKKSNTDYYYIKHAIDGKYLTYNIKMGNSSNDGRMRVHLEQSPSDEDSKLFAINYVSNGKYYQIETKKEASKKYLNVTNGNQHGLLAADAPSPKTNDGPKTDGTTQIAVSGIIGLWTNGTEDTSKWYLEKATIDPPTITNNFNGTVTISVADGATLYYTIDGTTPTTSTTTTATSTVNVNLNQNITVIKAIAKSPSDAFPTIESTYTIPQCEKPEITSVDENYITISSTLPDAVIYYSIDANAEPTTLYTLNNQIDISSVSVVKAKVTRLGYIDSDVTYFYHMIEVHSSAEISMEGYYYLASDFVSIASIGTTESPFKGIIDGQFNIIHSSSALDHPLVGYADGAVIKNVIIGKVNITSGTNIGSICNEADGETKIYNCGVQAGSVSGGTNVGGLVGLIKTNSKVRVVNCYNYADVSGSNNAAGIVGKNEGTVGNVRIALCMMYGKVSDALTISPVYTGNHTSNAQNFTEYNYYLYSTEKDATTGQRVERIPYTKASGTIPSAYNDQLAIDKEEYLTRFPFYRHILNTHRELASYFLFGDYEEDHVDEIGHWVSKKGASAPKYPILEKWEENRQSTPTKEHNDLPRTQLDYAGKLLTNMGTQGYLDVSMSIDGEPFTAKLPITDMDTLRYDYTYGKVILPFANEYKVNTDYDYICTGWKITGVSGGNPGSFENYNFADRNSTSKDIYSEESNPFIYAQGGYYIVPTGVTGITLEANFAKAVYLSDASYEVGYNSSYGGRTSVGDDVPTQFHSHTVHKSLKDAVNALTITTTNPHKQAIVLVGNYHYDLAKGDLATGKGFTLMSIDADNNQEPDYGFYSIAPDRPQTPALRFDFLPIISLGMAAKVNGSYYYPGIPIWKPRGWYEQTETTVSIMNQFELDSGSFTKDEKDYAGKGQNPCIINGGYFVQMIRSNNTDCSKVSYFKIGGNAYVKEFYPGSHSKINKSTTIVPVNVTGGQVEECFMTGYKSGATAIGPDIRFWCSGGKIGKFLGAYMDKPKETSSSDGHVNMTAAVDHALIGSFFGGGTSQNAAITGNISVTINNSKVDYYCGGPEFGNMEEGKTVTTTANHTTFGKYYGAGFGGTAITYSPKDGELKIANSVSFSGYNYSSTRLTSLTGNETWGLATCYKFEFLMHSQDKSKVVARFITGYANFSLATTGNVTNNLTDCTVENDFYGAGCQGKVSGTVTSTLKDCTIKGNAYGGGYKAESNKVLVYPAAAPRLSEYNGETGIFSEFGTTTPETYNWSQGTGSSPTKDESNPVLYTPGSVTMTDLGNVTGNITLTIDGTAEKGTTIGTVGDNNTGNVFGGGNESKSLDDTTVTLKGKTKVLGSVFGGGNEATVSGSTTVNIGVTNE